VGLFQRKYKGNLDTNADEYLGYIVGATGRMQRLIKDLLDYSIIGNDKESIPTDCNKVIHEVLEDMAVAIRECSAELNVSKLPVINAYSELKLLFQNLISNAIKYRKQGETLRIYITAKELEKEWLFAVKDNGIGIEKAYQERIFIIFQKLHTQDKYAGTGIGLAHCKKIVELHGGRIWVSSEPGHGCTFYFTIPKNEKA
jgi:light-regulated signal transduction histidine kinase (bacteriophytochrome)